VKLGAFPFRVRRRNSPCTNSFRQASLILDEHMDFRGGLGYLIAIEALKQFLMLRRGSADLAGLPAPETLEAEVGHR
jgi:hypothetical protein